MSNEDGSTSEAMQNTQATQPQTSQQSSSPVVPITLAGIKPPSNLNLTDNVIENWKSYRQRWENYAIVANLAVQPETYKVALFLHCLGAEALKVYNGLSFESEEDRQNLSKILEKLEEYAIGEVNETYERYVFNSRNQGASESIEAYITELRKLMKTCNFCDCLKDTLLRDRIVLGVTNKNLRKRLLQERKLTLKKCIDICRSVEAASNQLKAVSEAEVDEVNKVSARNQRKTGHTKQGRGTEQSPGLRSCKFCGGEHSFQKEKCPAWGQRCRKCGGRNHFARKCLKQTQRQQQQQEGSVRQLGEASSEESETSDVEYVAGITTNVNAVEVGNSGYSKEIYAMMEIQNKNIRLQVDSGASINIITQDLIGECPLKPTKTKLVMWNKSEVTALGSARLIIRNPRNNRKYSVEFIVVNKGLQPLLGAKAAQQMKLLTVHQKNFVPASPPIMRQSSVTHVTTRADLVQKYPEVFKQPIGTLPGMVHLEVTPEASSVITPPRRIPTALKEPFKKELDKLVRDKIIAPVEQPTPWVSSVVVTTKKSGALRICIDPRPLNKVLKRETYQIPVLDETLPELAQAKVFSTVDLRSGFWHCVLDEQSSLLTTFATPYGRYRWLRLPFGLSVSPEIFQKRLNQAIEGLDGVLNIADDILIYGMGETEEIANSDHDRKLQALLERCRDRGVVLNQDKLELRLKRVKFMGHVLTDNGLEPDPGKIKAIKEMPRPQNVEDAQRLNGFVNYLAKFLPHLADVMEPIRRLTRKDAEWIWAEEQERAFCRVKAMVVKSPVLSYFNPALPLEIQCDASQKGLGAVLMQQGKPIAFISRALTPTEQRYAHMEKEMLAIVFSLERFHQYTFGRPVLVYSDHKPLESILKKPLSQAPRRLQGMMMRLQQYNVEVGYERGKNMLLADLLSRAYLPYSHDPDHTEFEHVNSANLLPFSESQLKQIRAETRRDGALQSLKAVIDQGWPNERKCLPPQVRAYFDMRDELTVEHELIFRGERVVIPTALRQSVKQKIHTSHMGTESCLRRARDCVFWPGMSAEIRQLVAACETCQKFSAGQPKETLESHELPSRPWEKIATDLFTYNNKEFLITVDYYSNFWEIDELSTTTAPAVIAKLKCHFARYGCPDTVISDNGPQFVSETFATFARDWEFQHRTISPWNSKANGKVEAAVKVAKQLLRKARDSKTDIHLALLDQRNTPTQAMTTSPVQRFLNRRTKTLLPTRESLLRPKVPSPEDQQQKIKEKQKAQAHYYNRNARDLKELTKGDVVRIKPSKPSVRVWKKGVVVQKIDNRSYVVETTDGTRYRRNRYHLRKTPASSQAPKEVEEVELGMEDNDPQEDKGPAEKPPSPTAETIRVEADTPSSIEQQSVPAKPARPQRERRKPAYLADYA